MKQRTIMKEHSDDKNSLVTFWREANLLLAKAVFNPRLQVALLSLTLLTQRLPVVKQVLQFQKALTAPLAQMVRSVSFAAGALGVFQAYSGASTFLVIPESPADGTLNEEFSLSFQVTATQEPAQSWEILGDVPEGLNFVGFAGNGNPNGEVLDGNVLNAFSGVLSGVPTESGQFSFTVQPYKNLNLQGNTTNTGAFTIVVNIAPPVISLHPDSTITKVGGRAQFFAGATDPQDVVRWRKDGLVLGGKTGGTLIIENVSQGDAGTYQAFVDKGSGNIFASQPAELTIDPNSSNDMVNISTRAFVGTGDNSLNGGFVVEGSSAKTVFIRAVGPLLPSVQPSLAGKVLEDPQLFLFRGGDFFQFNDNWEDAGNGAEITSVALDLGARPFDAGSKDSAMLVTLNPGAYTVVVLGASSTTGIALVEAYQVD